MGLLASTPIEIESFRQLNFTAPIVSNIPFPATVEAVLTDLDGTLIHCDQEHMKRFTPHLLKHFDCQVPAGNTQKIEFSKLEDLYSYVCFDRLVRGLGKLDKDFFRYECYFTLDKLRQDMTQVLPGIPEALDDLNKRGIRIALCTARDPNSRLYNQLDERGISDSLDAIVTRHDSYNCGSIKDHIFRTGSSSVWVEPEKCIVIGDTKDDIISARRIGMYVVGVLTGLATKEDLIEAGACAVIESFADLPALITYMARQQIST